MQSKTFKFFSKSATAAPSNPSGLNGLPARFGTDQRRFTRQKGTRVEIAVLISWLARLVFVCLAVVVGTAALFRAAFVDRTRGARLSLTGVAIAAAMLIYAQLSYPLAWVNAGGRMWMRYGPPGVVFESTTYAFAALLFVLGYAMSIWHTRRPVNAGQLVEIATPGVTPDSTTPPTVVLWKVAAFRWIMALTVTFLIGLAAGLVSYEPLQTTMMQWRRSFLGTDSDWHR